MGKVNYCAFFRSFLTVVNSNEGNCTLSEWGRYLMAGWLAGWLIELLGENGGYKEGNEGRTEGMSQGYIDDLGSRALSLGNGMDGI